MREGFNIKEFIEKYDTDKSEQYLAMYDQFFSKFKTDKINLLELGVYKGGSLLLWRDYFVNGRIAGIDVNPVTIDDSSDRVNFYQGKQEDIDFLKMVALKETGSKGFDIIIDDASHIAFLTKTSFLYLFKSHLNERGIYAIEDWGTGYWPSWPDGRKYTGKNHPYGMVGFIKELIDECGMADINKGLSKSYNCYSSLIESIHISHGLCIVIKKASEDSENAR